MTKFLLNGRAVAAGVLLCLSLAACGGGDGGDASAAPPAGGGDTNQPGDPGQTDKPTPSLRCAP